MALEDMITGQSSTCMLAKSNVLNVSEILTPQRLAWAPETPSIFIAVCWRLKLSNLVGGVTLAR